jgi:hypothetical protein
MRFHGLPEPPLPRVCSAKHLEKQVGHGFLGWNHRENPIVELVALAVSEDEEQVIALIHAENETDKFVGTSAVSAVWFNELFEEHTLVRGAPEDIRSLAIVPCRLFEGARPSRPTTPLMTELLALDRQGFARNLAHKWFQRGRPVRKTQQFFIALLKSNDSDIKKLANEGLELLASALSNRNIPPLLKRHIAEVCLAIGRIPQEDLRPNSSDDKPDTDC